MGLISQYFTDRIDIITISQDKYGAKTETAVLNILARVEYKNQTVKDSNGKETFSNGLILIGSENIVRYDSLIRIVSINGVASQDATKKLGIKMISKPHGWPSEFWKVYI
jgi:hypothetical protein